MSVYADDPTWYVLGTALQVVILGAFERGAATRPLTRLVRDYKDGCAAARPAHLQAVVVAAGGLADRVAASGRAIDVVCAIPDDPARLAERGFSLVGTVGAVLADLLARPFAADLLWRPGPSVSLRARDTERARRRAIAQGLLAGADATGRHVLVVDDVVNFGATMRAAARALRMSGAASVTGAALLGARRLSMRNGVLPVQQASC